MTRATPGHHSDRAHRRGPAIDASAHSTRSAPIPPITSGTRLGSKMLSTAPPPTAFPRRCWRPLRASARILESMFDRVPRRRCSRFVACCCRSSTRRSSRPSHGTGRCSRGCAVNRRLPAIWFRTPGPPPSPLRPAASGSRLTGTMRGSKVSTGAVRFDVPPAAGGGYSRHDREATEGQSFSQNSSVPIYCSIRRRRNGPETSSSP